MKDLHLYNILYSEQLYTFELSFFVLDKLYLYFIFIINLFHFFQFLDHFLFFDG